MGNPCETCDIKIFLKCRWVFNAKPIKGWKAKRIMKKGGSNGLEAFETYNITFCPDYIKDRQRPHEKAHNQSNFRCAICNKPLPKGRRKYCGKECARMGSNNLSRKFYSKGK